MKHFLTILLFIPIISFSQINILDTSTWIVSSGSVPGYDDYGPSQSNVREMDIGPHGTSELIWKSLANSISDNDGGWNTDYHTIDPSKTYRFTVWIKRLNSSSGTAHFGFNALDANDNGASLNYNGSVNNNPYFRVSPPPTINDWYLMVGFVYGHNHTTGEYDEDGLYDTSGNRVVTSYHNYKFSSTAVKVRHRNYFRQTVAPNEQWFFAPTIYEVNGSEPTIQDLLNPSSGNVAANGISLSTNNLNLDVGESQNLVASVSPSNATDQSVAWASSNSSVVTVNSGGLVTALSEGSVTITATTVDGGYTEEATISVSDSGGSNPPTEGDSLWSTTGSNIFFNSGNVGIATSNIGNYELAVGGDIRAEEVRVDTGWADYVFHTDYDLPTLKEVKQHIKEKGHLINIPSASEVEANGIELGEMNKLLLEKIEELTLYILEQEKRIEKLEENKK